MGRLLVMLAISYPLVVHAAVASGSAWLTMISVALLGILLIAPGLRAGRLWAWMAAPAFAAGLGLLVRAHVSWLPLYAPPVLINFFVAWLFGRTLLAGQTPLIERLVRLLHDPDEPLDAEIPRYARRLTLAWTILLGSLGFVNLGLALCVVPSGILALLGVAAPVAVSPSTWSLFANLLSYLIVGAFFLIEYGYRQRRFPQQPYRNLFDFIRRAVAVGHRAMSSK